MKKKIIYPHWVCSKCGLKASKGKSFTISTWHFGKCEVCKKENFITEIRDFYYGNNLTTEEIRKIK